MMRIVGRRATFLLLILVLLVAPAANAWCSTVCLAAAISSGCAHALQPSDDLPVDKPAPVAMAVSSDAVVMAQIHEAGARQYAPVSEQRTPLRI